MVNGSLPASAGLTALREADVQRDYAREVLNTNGICGSTLERKGRAM